MLRIGAAGQQVDVIVGAARLARIDAAGRVVAGRPPWRRGTGACLCDEHAAAAMHHRILHRHPQPPALAGARPIEERADDAERHQHASAVSPIVGPGLTGLPSRSTVMLIAPPTACAIGSNDSPFSYGLPSPKPLTWA